MRRLGLGSAAAVVLASALSTALLLGRDEPDRRTSATVTTDRDRAGGVATAAHPLVTERQPGRPVSLQRLIGQRLVARLNGTSADRRVLQQARAGSIGGVILFAGNITSVAQTRALVRALQRAARDGGNPPLWVTVDQEGGAVRRFSSLPPKRSAAQLAAADQPVTSSRTAGRATARGLRRAGVNVNLAPVADVRHTPGGFLAERSFADSAAEATPVVCAFAKGLGGGGVLPTLKHFPGLGYATATTDAAPVDIDRSVGQLQVDLEPYRRCANIGLVMISSARYPRMLHSGQPAVLARSLYTRVLRDTGFKGLTISDDLQTPALADQSDLAVRAVRSGLDLLLYATDAAGSARAHAQLLDAARRRRLSRPSLRRSYDRILRRKAVLLRSTGLAFKRLLPAPSRPRISPQPSAG